mgnify:CR=1 FL=1
MSENSDYDYQQLSDLYATAEQAKDIRELLVRTHTTLLGRVQDQLNALKDTMLDMDDPTTQEFRRIHMRARVLGALFAEMNAVWDAWVSQGNTPARATVEASLAHPDYTVEIVVIAAR